MGKRFFFEDFSCFDNQLALIDCESGEHLTYSELEERVQEAVCLLGSKRELVFIVAKNDIVSTVYYLAALRSDKVVYLLESLDDDKSLFLCELYKPNLIIQDGSVKRLSSDDMNFHTDLALLLSTSGSTGSPKFVKLSKKNIQSNAESIAEYLKLSSIDNALSYLKLHYSYGLSILHSHLEVGATISYTCFGVLDSQFWSSLRKFSATSFSGVPYTFEMMFKQGFDLSTYPSLRYITQAGGKLDASLVEAFANLAAPLNIEFYVMYGQTEAAPRISYLPPDLVSLYPHSIGKAIPGGTLFLVDENGIEITGYDEPGELAYCGDNVMMGYAEQPGDFIEDKSPDVLFTGDIACKTENDLFYITGRAKRFVKLFGLRLNLDEIQSFVKTIEPNSVVTGTDQYLLIAVETNKKACCKNIREQISTVYSIPQSKIHCKQVDSLPLLPSGKYNYKVLLEEQDESKKSLFKRFLDYCFTALGLNENQWESIECLFCEALGVDRIDSSLSLSEMECDSLSFVFLSVELERCLEDLLPESWKDVSVAELNRLYNDRRLSSS
ncbi:AMP-binding protein [Litoribrevibacter albus]|uniref:AMP-dependent synthetase/ligase domain-containing protein n=1 Tax=Litoribrevibacter albus TaxID=1473156 RepID=A0AA37S8D0_9GAMM|nr:AMP-binding protein [Litoribrevibacter albus]GLQ30286.1 hypothetical protein GCM10007876_07640 [Litoribrevibacter albus]